MRLRSGSVDLSANRLHAGEEMGLLSCSKGHLLCPSRLLVGGDERSTCIKLSKSTITDAQSFFDVGNDNMAIGVAAADVFSAN